MYKIKQKDGNGDVTVEINGVKNTFEFEKAVEMDDATAEVLKGAGYEVEVVEGVN